MTDQSPIDMVLAKLQGVKPSGDTGRQWTAACPAHGDAVNSLSIGVKKDGVVLLKCHAGCDNKAVVAALGLDLKDLYPGKQPRPQPAGVSVAGLGFDKRLPAAFLRDVCGLEDDASGDTRRVLIPYRDEAGAVLFTRKRTALAAKAGTRQPKGVRLRAYGLWRLPEYRASGGVLILVEGESDAWTLWFHGYPALGVPGADAVKGVQAADLAGFDTIYVWQDGKTKDTDASGEHFVNRMAARVKELRPGAVVRVIASGTEKDPNEINQRYAEEFKPRFDAILAASTDPPEPVKPDADGTPSFPLTDMGNAQRLVARHGKDLRYAEEIGQWYVWDGGRWRPRKAGPVIQRAKQTVRGIIAELTGETDTNRRTRILAHALSSESGRSVREMVRLAESEPGILVETPDLDADRFLLNVQNGTIDLRTGELRPHRREDLLTKVCPVDYDPAAPCPAWKVFLARVFSTDPDNPEDRGDADLIQFVKRLFGYSLTGDVGEQVLPIFWGGGSNGKSTLLNAVREIMGRGYAAKAPRGLLMAKHNESHPTELTVLFGARLVIATESRRGQRLSEDLVKDLTGGEAITARKMKQDFFEFDPTHKLLLCTNHRPRIPESDDGIWRRVFLVPFKMKFWNPAKGESGPDHLCRDNSLADKLRKEYPGILAWLVRGCLEWQRSGLGAPIAVREETATYRQEEDRVAQFLTDRCQVSNAVGNTPLKEVYADFCRWCEEAGWRAMARNDFSADLRSHNVVVKNGTGNKVVCCGLRLTTYSRVGSTLEDLDD